jgi:CRP-like cAMP-binding protein
MNDSSTFWDFNVSDKTDIDSLRSAPGACKQFASGAVVIKQGDVADSMFFVLEGRLQVIVNYRTEDERYVALLERGDLFGEMALFLNEHRTATVVALENAVVHEIDRDTVMEFMRQNPENAYNIVELLCTRLKNVLSSLADY